jgi:undecaprenyl-diphosphatase
MLDSILAFDRALFLKVNTEWTSVFFDAVLPWCRDAKNWIPLYVIVVGWSFYKFGWKMWVWLVTIGLMMLISDQLSSHLIKPLVARPRPCNDAVIGTQVRLLVGCTESFSFTSSHAVNHFCIATFLIFTLKPYWGKIVYAFWFWAFIISYAQVYVGRHFPIDISAGALLGIGLGYIFSTIFLKKIGMPSIKLSWINPEK